MTKRICLATAALTVSVAVLSPLLAASPAQAADSRPCVSKHESNGHHHGLSRAAVESRWEVKGLGRSGTMANLLDPAFNTYIVDYPACGYNDVEAGVAVFYREDDDTVRFVMRYWSETSTLHGHARVR